MKMNYEQKYKDALDAAKHIYDDMKSGGNFGGMEDLEVIFPKLRESEDERIRKEILDYIKVNYHWANKEELEQRRRFIAYLEKQKEQKPAEITPNQFDGITYGMQGYSTEKLAEWSEEDEEILNELLDHCNTENATWYNWLKSLRPQPKQEWSEGDIKKIRSEEYTKGFNDAAFGGKLKEWSVEDEDRIRQIERIAQQAGCTQKLQEEIHDWLKSLRPQPHWKPSEGQMMEEAVGGRYMKADGKVYVESWPLDIEPNSVKAGDEVRLIVLPKED